MGLFDTFHSDWSHDPVASAICEDVYRYLLDSKLDHYSFAQLAKAANSNDEKKIAHVLEYLSSPKWRILKQVFMFIEGDEWYEFAYDDVVEFIKSREFPHPRLGTPIRDINEIVIAFELGDHFDGGAS